MVEYVKHSHKALSIFAAMLAATFVFAVLMGPSVATAGPALDSDVPLNPPTEIISLTPGTQSASSSAPPNCPATASWTVTSSGGSGVYTVSASFGDGTSQSWYNQPSTTTGGHKFYGCSTKTFNQSWSVSSAGGGTAYRSSRVYYN